MRKIRITIILLALVMFGSLGIEQASAAVGYDATSESHTGATGSVSQASFSWTHTPAGTPGGVIVFVTTLSATDTITSVTYGGTVMTRVSGGAAIDSAGEAGRTDTFFLGFSVPTGAQTVTINRTNDATEMYASAATVTAGNETDVTGTVLLQVDGTLAEQSVDDGSPGTSSVRFASIYTGLQTLPVAGASSTLLNSIDFGPTGAVLVRETTAGQGARNVGFSSGTSDDRAAVHIAVKELPPMTLTQSSYRWFRNTDSLDLASFTSEPATTSSDYINALALDKEKEIVYAVGVDGVPGNNEWRFERRNAKTSYLDYALTSDPSSGNDAGNDVKLDNSGLYLYAAGYDNTGGNRGWRVEKRDARSGELVYATSSNPSSGADEAMALALDEGGNDMYIVGSDSTGGDEGWRIEKRALDTGALEYAVTTNPSATAENAEDIALDTVNGHMYVVGKSATTTDLMWRIEKRNLSDGSLVYATTTNYSSGLDTAMAIALGTSTMYVAGRDTTPGDGEWRVEKRDLSGNVLYAVTTNPTGGQDIVNDIVLQNNETRFYLVGEESNAWRIEKRLSSDGSLVGAFGTSGVVTSNPSSGGDAANSVVFDNTDNRIYVGGYDSLTGTREWRVERRDTADGNPTWGNALASQDTSAVAPARRNGLRLRTLVHVANSTLPTSQSFKLQYATRSGTCDTAFSGETYADMSASSGDIRYLTNAGAANGTTTLANFRDPTHGADVVIPAAYVSDGNFTSPLAIAFGKDALFDFALQNYSAPAGTSYCFRVVKADSSLLDTYSVVPELVTGATLSMPADQLFEYTQATTSAPVFTIVAATTTGGAITAANDIRIKINFGTSALKWDTGAAALTLGGTASSKASATASFTDAFTAVIDVTSDFSQGETLTINGLSLYDFSAVNASSSPFELYVDGASDSDADDMDEKKVVIRGKFDIDDHPAGQQTNSFEDNAASLTGAELMNLKLKPRGESATTTGLVVEIINSHGFVAGDITNVKLVVDENLDGTVNAGEVTTLGGTGSVSLPGVDGTITFSSAFSIATATSLILQADIAQIEQGDSLPLRVRPNNITVIGKVSVSTLVPTGSTLVLSHGRRIIFFGGGGGVESSGSGFQQGNGGSQGGGGGTEPPPPPPPPQGGGGSGGGGGDSG